MLGSIVLGYKAFLPPCIVEVTCGASYNSQSLGATLASSARGCLFNKEPSGQDRLLESEPHARTA